MKAKQDSYTFNLYDPVSLTIQSDTKEITHFGELERYIENVNDNVDITTKSAIDEIFLFFERNGYCRPSEGCWLAIKCSYQKENTFSVEDVAHKHSFFGELTFGQNENRRINTATVLQILNANEGKFPYKSIYRVKDHSIIYPSMLSLFNRRYEKHPEESRRLFYLLRCPNFNGFEKRRSLDVIPFTSSYFQLFLSILMKKEDAGYDVDDKQLRTIGAIEFEIKNLPDLDHISQLIKETIESEEFTLAAGHQLTMGRAESKTNEMIPF